MRINLMFSGGMDVVLEYRTVLVVTGNKRFLFEEDNEGRKFETHNL